MISGNLIFLGGIVVVAMLVITLTRASCYLEWRWRKNIKQKEPATRKHYYPGQGNIKQRDGMGISARIHTVANQLEAQLEQQNRQDRERAIREKVTIIAAIVAAAFAGFSAWVFNGQLEEMRADQRPWIKIVSLEPGYLRWIPEKFRTKDLDAWASMYPRIVVSNVGKSPAFAVQAGAWGYVSQNGSETAIHVRERYCGYLRSGPLPRGQILFPGDSESPSHLGWGVKGFSISRLELERADTVVVDGKPTYAFFVIGCADYMFGSPPTHHQTYFWFEIVRKGQPVYGMPSYEGRFRIGEDVPADEIAFLPLEGGNDAN